MHVLLFNGTVVAQAERWERLSMAVARWSPTEQAQTHIRARLSTDPDVEVLD